VSVPNIISNLLEITQGGDERHTLLFWHWFSFFCRK